jgi:hypothetical protein
MRSWLRGIHSSELARLTVLGQRVRVFGVAQGLGRAVGFEVLLPAQRLLQRLLLQAFVVAHGVPRVAPAGV